MLETILIFTKTINMKKINFSALLLLAIPFLAQTQVLRIATSDSAITTQIPGYSQVSTINIKTISYTPSTPSSYPTPVDDDSTTEAYKVNKYADVITANITMVDGNITSTSLFLTAVEHIIKHFVSAT